MYIKSDLSGEVVKADNQSFRMMVRHTRVELDQTGGK